MYFILCYIYILYIFAMLINIDEGEHSNSPKYIFVFVDEVLKKLMQNFRR